MLDQHPVIQCAWCHSIKVGGTFRQDATITTILDVVKIRHSGGEIEHHEVSHGICPECQAMVAPPLSPIDRCLGVRP